MNLESPQQVISRETIVDAGVRVGLGALAEVNRLTSTEFYLWGSQGRAIAAIAYTAGVDQLSFADIKHCFTAKESGWLDIDFTFSPEKFNWADACRLCENIYDSTQETVVLDPHYALFDNGCMYSSPFTTRKSFVYDLHNAITIQFPNGVIKCADLKTQLAFLGRPDIVLRPKYAQYMADYLQRFPEFADSTHQSISAFQYELLLRKHGVDKNVFQLVYHAAVPTVQRGEFAQMRNVLKGGVKTDASQSPPDKPLNFRSTRPLFW